MEKPQSISNKEEQGYASLKSERQFLILLASKLISRFGDSIDTIAYSWMVYKLTGSAALIASLYAVNALPNLIFGLISGVATNYFSKKKIVLICDMGRGLVVLTTCVLFFTGYLEPWHLFVFTFLNSTFESYRGPASMSLYAHIVPKEKMQHAKSLDSSAVKTVEIAGFAAAGVLIAAIGLSGVILLDAITFFICAGLISFIKLENEYKEEGKLTLKACRDDIAEGVKYLKGNKLILHVSIFATIFNLFVVPVNALQAVYIGDVLGGDSFMLSVFSISILLGIIIGGLLVPKLKGKFSGKHLFISAGVFIGVSYLGLSLLGSVSSMMWKYVGLALTMFMMGFFIPMINMQLGVALMTQVEKKFIPRVGAAINSFALCTTPVGAFLAGGLTKYVSISHMFLLCSILLILLSVAQLRNEPLDEL